MAKPAHTLISTVALLAASAAQAQSIAELRLGDSLARTAQAFGVDPGTVPGRPRALYFWGPKNAEAVVCEGRLIEITKDRGDDYLTFLRSVHAYEESYGPAKHTVTLDSKGGGIAFYWSTPNQELSLSYNKLTDSAGSLAQSLESTSIVPAPCPWSDK